MNSNRISAHPGVQKQRSLNVLVAAAMSAFAALLLSACSSTAQVRPHEKYTAKPQFSRSYLSPKEVDRLPIVIYSDDKKTSELLVSAAGDLNGYHVLTDYLIDERGVPFDIQCVLAPTEAMARAAEKAIADWRFKPATKGGKPVVFRDTAGFISSRALLYSNVPQFTSVGYPPARQTMLGL